MVYHCLNRVLLIKKTDFRFACRHQGNCVVVVGGEADLDIQSFFFEIALLDSIIEECVDGVGLPVENNIHLAELFLVPCLRGAFCLFFP